MIIDFIISVLGNWVAGALAHPFLSYLIKRKEERAIEETLNELCEKYQLKDAFKNRLKELLKALHTKPTEFIKELDLLLKEFGAQITAEKFIIEFFVNFSIKLANRHGDYIATIIEFVKLETLEKLSEEYSELKPILKKYKDEYEAKKASFIIGDLNSIIKEIKEIEPFPYYIEREEVKELQEAIKEKDIIIIKGPPGAGKSTMLKHSLEFFKDFRNFVWIKSFYNYDSYGHVLRAELNNLDNFVIVWDDIYLFKEEEDIRPTLENILDLVERNNKKFKFIGCSRRYIELVGRYIPPEKIKVIELKSFNKIELVEKCIEYFKVKLDNVKPADILKIGDGTPLYIISFFIRFKGKTIKPSDLDGLPRDVIKLWESYITELRDRLEENHIAALRSIALLSHTSPEIKIAEIDTVYEKVFRASGIVDRSLLEDLYKLNLVMMYNESCSMHDAHAEAVENVFELDSTIIQKFVEIIDINKLRALGNWMVGKFKTARSYAEYLLIILNKILELDKSDSVAWNNKGVVYSIMEKYNEAIKCYEEAIKLNPYYAGAWNNKGNVYDEMKEYNKALECYNKALEIDPYDAGAWNNKGNVYDEMKEYNKALECYEEAIKLNPYDAKAWNNKGIVYSIMEKYDEASKCFMKALSLFIINQEHIELIPKLLGFMIENSKDEVIKAEARAIRATLLYLSKYLPKEEYIKKLNSLKKTPRIEVLIDAIINKKDTPMEIKDVVDEVFDLLKKQVLRSI